MNEPVIPKPIVWILSVVLIIFIALLAVGKGYDISERSGNRELPKNTISISAQGKVTAAPDLATVSITVTSQGQDVSKLQDENSKKINAIIEMAKAEGVDKKDITSSGPQINEQRNYDYQDKLNYNKIIGYEVDQTVTVKVRGVDNDSSRAGRIIDKATDGGANRVSGVYYSFDDPDNYREQAREEAVKKAKEKAAKLADVAGISLGKVVSISESGVANPYPMAYDRAGGALSAPMMEQKTVAPALEPGSQDITADVTVVFEVK